MLTKDLLWELFDYMDGILYWKVAKANCIKIGDAAGTMTSKGYLQTMINKRHHMNHRLIFMMHHGYLPDYIDHINGIQTDNRIENLRPTTCVENAYNCKVSRNNKSGYLGVYWKERDKKWYVSMQINGKKMYVGYYKSLDEAGAASIAFRKEHHGEFYRETQ